MLKKLKELLLDIHFYLWHGACDNCKNYNSCRILWRNKLDSPCCFRGNDLYPNMYGIDKTCEEYKNYKAKFIKK